MLEPVPQEQVCHLLVRGQGTAQRRPAMFPGLPTVGIESPQPYIFRGVVADAVRGLEHLLCRPEVERSGVVSMGNDVALMAGALGARAAMPW